MATYASQPHLPQSPNQFQPGLGTGMGRFATLMPFGQGSKMPMMPPNPAATPQGPQTTPATAQGIMQTMKQAVLEHEALRRGGYVFDAGALAPTKRAGAALHTPAERGMRSLGYGQPVKSASSAGLDLFLSARTPRGSRFGLGSGRKLQWHKRAMGMPAGAMPQMAAGSPPPQPPVGAPAMGGSQPVPGDPSAGAMPGALPPPPGDPSMGGMPAGGATGPMNGPMGGPPTLNGEVPPMGMPPTPLLPSNPRLNPPRLADQEDYVRRQQLNDLLSMDDAALPQTPNEATDEVNSDLVAMGGKVAMDWLQSAVKSALHVEQGGAVSKATANTIGRVAGLPMLLLSGKALHTPDEQKHQELGKRFDSVSDGALNDTVMRLGGTNIVDDLLWKKQRGDQPEKWHQRIGGRVWHNPKTGIVGKALGTALTPLVNLETSLTRSPHYNWATDVAHQFTDEPAVAEHELGHAMDFNHLYGLKPGETQHKGLRGFLSRQGKGLARDAYGLAGSSPLATLWHEGAANLRAVQMHQKSKHLMPEDEAREHEIRQMEVLPASYGSYLSGAMGVGGLPGIIGGKLYGLMGGQIMREQDRNAKAKEEKAKAPRDGDHDGKVHDGTKDEAPVRKAASWISNLNLKCASQDNGDGSLTPARSATGESKGLKFAPSYDGRGQDAWESVSHYFKGHSKRTTQPNPFLGKHASDKYGERLKRLAMRRHPGTEAEAMAAFDAEFPKFAGEAARREGESREDWLARLALPEEEFKTASFGPHPKHKRTMLSGARPTFWNVADPILSAFAGGEGEEKEAGFDFMDLEYLKKFGVNRKGNGKLIGSNSLSGTEPARHAQRVKAALDKLANVALVRMIRQGLLSPQNITRAARAMPQGKFRYVENLGRGQFNLADKVVGNVGGHAGQMVRKLPTRQVASAGGEFGAVKQLVDDLNTKYGPTQMQQAVARVTKKPVDVPIAPYHHVGDTGAFQALGTGRVPQLPKPLTDGLTDLHPGNIGPGGQVFDFGVKETGPLASPGMTPHGGQFKNEFIDPLSGFGGRRAGTDILANIDGQNITPQMAGALHQATPQSNNLIRRYWGVDAGQRPSVLAQANRSMPQRSHALLQNATQMPVRSPNATPGGATTPPVQPKPTLPPTSPMTPPVQTPSMKPKTLAPTGGLAMGGMMMGGMNSENPYAKAAEDVSFEDLSPFARGFFAHCVGLGLNNEQIKVAMDRAEEKFGADVREELNEGLVKLAKNPLGAMVSHYAMPALKGLWNGGRQMMSNPGVRSAVAGNVTRSGGGALVGGFSGPQGDPSNWKGPLGIEFNPYRAVAGAAAFNPKLRSSAAGMTGAKPILNTVQRSLTGGMVGNTIDQTANLFGYDTGGQGQQIGQWAGAASGVAKPALGHVARTSSSPMVRNMAGGAMRANEKVWQHAHDFGTKLDDAFTHLPSWAWRRATQGPGQAFYPQAARNTSGQIARGISGLGLGATGLGLAHQGVQSYLHNTVGNELASRVPEIQQVIDGELANARGQGQQFLDDAKQQVTEFADQTYNQYKDRAMQDAPQLGQQALSGALGGFDMGKITEYADKALSMVGLDPTRMSGLQKMMLIGGVLTGGAGLLGGSRTAMGVGGGAAGLAMLPYFLNSEAGRNLMGSAGTHWNTLTGGGTQQEANQQPAQPGQGAAPPVNQLSARDEFRHQQKLQGVDPSQDPTPGNMSDGPYGYVMQ